MLLLFSFKFIPLWTFQTKVFDSTTLNSKLLNTSKHDIIIRLQSSQSALSIASASFYVINLK